MVAVSHPPALHPTFGAPCVSGFRAYESAENLGETGQRCGGFSWQNQLGIMNFYVGLHRDATRIHMWIVSGKHKTL